MSDRSAAVKRTSCIDDDHKLFAHAICRCQSRKLHLSLEPFQSSHCRTNDIDRTLQHLTVSASRSSLHSQPPNKILGSALHDFALAHHLTIPYLVSQPTNSPNLACSLLARRSCLSLLLGTSQPSPPTDYDDSTPPILI